MEIRRMTEHDVEQVALLEREIFSDAWSAAAFYESLENPNAILLLTENGGEILGYCCMYTVFDEGEIVNVAVNPKYRRQGIGEQMLKLLFENFTPRQVVNFYLEVRAHNEAAKHLYEKFGFGMIGVRRNFYEKPVEDAIVMRLQKNESIDCQ